MWIRKRCSFRSASKPLFVLASVHSFRSRILSSHLCRSLPLHSPLRRTALNSEAPLPVGMEKKSTFKSGPLYGIALVRVIRTRHSLDIL